MSSTNFESKAINYPSRSASLYIPEPLVPGRTYKIRFEWINNGQHESVEYENVCQIYSEVNNGIYDVIMGNPQFDSTNNVYNCDALIMLGHNDNYGSVYCNINADVMVTISEIRPLGKIPTQELSKIYTFDGNNLELHDLCDILYYFSQQMNLGMSFFPTEPIISAGGGSMA